VGCDDVTFFRITNFCVIDNVRKQAKRVDDIECCRFFQRLDSHEHATLGLPGVIFLSLGIIGMKFVEVLTPSVWKG
jgi:hypothetical protein